MTKFISFISFMLFIVTLTACGGGSDSPAPVVFKVNSVAPANGEVNVPVNSAMTLSFSSDVDCTTATTASVVLSTAAAPVSGAVACSGSSVTFTPDAQLMAFSDYILNVDTTVAGIATTTLASAFQSSFTTGNVGDTLAPVAGLSSPLDGATGVAVDKTISLEFNEPLDGTTVNTTTVTLFFGGTPVVGAVAYDAATNTVTFSPRIQLNADTLYTATVAAGVTDLAGNVMGGDVIWEFTTGADSVSPSIIAVDPLDGATSVSVNNPIRVTFDDRIDPATVNDVNFSLVDGFGTAVSFSPSYNPDSSVVTFNPDVALAIDGYYTATVSANVADLAGNLLGQAMVWSFTPSSSVVISGQVTYESVQPTTAGLDYANSINLPTRHIAVEALTASGTVLASGVTDDAGNYSFAVPSSTEVFIRAKAKSQSAAATLPSWDVEVVDNTAGKALYVLDSALFNSGTAPTMTRDLHAASGWNGSSYSELRAAAPFAILDTVYSAVELVASVDATAVMPQLLVNWSVNNIAASGDKTIGLIGTSHFTSVENQLYVLGFADNDTDEFDSHVIAHEWGHFFEANLSRIDSIGGGHGGGDKLDPRLAFSEGFGNAFSAMVLNDPLYVDTYGANQASAFSIDVEDNDYDTTSVGWYSEASVQSILYDIYDSTSDSPDNVSLGFGPIYDVLVVDTPQQESFVTIYSFIDSLKARVPGSSGGINALLAYEDISTTFVDEWDSSKTETNFSSAPALPDAVYTKLATGSATSVVCSHVVHGTYNKLFNRRFFYFTVPSTTSYTITAVPQLIDGDVDFLIYRAGVLEATAETYPGTTFAPETLFLTLTAGTYVGEVYEYGHIVGTVSSPECFTLIITQQ
jgi:hypothetical protein